MFTRQYFLPLNSYSQYGMRFFFVAFHSIEVKHYMLLYKSQMFQLCEASVQTNSIFNFQIDIILADYKFIIFLTTMEIQCSSLYLIFVINKLFIPLNAFRKIIIYHCCRLSVQTTFRCVAVDFIMVFF